MKKALVCVLFVLSLVLVISFEVSAETTIVASGDCGDNSTSLYCQDNLHWKFTSDGILTISGTGVMGDFAYSGAEWLLEPWLEYEDEIVAVVIEEGVTSIGAYAFSSCINLKYVNLPGSLTTIERGAFYECRALTEIAIPDSVTEMNGEIFEKCVSLEKITLPSNISSISGSMFCQCTRLQSIVIPESVEVIGVEAFSYCVNLTTITLPQNVKWIKSKAFSGCSQLSSISLPEGLTSMGYDVFSTCKKLKYVTVPSTVTSMSHTFNKAHGLETIRFLGDAPNCGSDLFGGVTATVFYPADNETWTKEFRQNYGGSITWVADYCGVNHTEEVIPEKAASCTQNGLTDGSRCSVCGVTIDEPKTVPAIGHNFGQWTQIKAPTVSEEGTEQRTCSRCGTTESRSIAKLEPPVTVPPTTVPPETAVPSEPTVPESTTVPETEATTQPSQTPTTLPEDTEAPTIAPTQPGGVEQEEPNAILTEVLIAGALILLGGAAAVWFFVLRKRK